MPQIQSEPPNTVAFTAMYDTLKILIPTAKLSAIAAHDGLEAEGITIIEKTISYDKTGEINKFKFKAEALKNLTGYYGANGLVVQGSLPKYYLGENVSSLTIAQTKQALNKLENVLGLPLLQYGIVKRLDLANTFIVQNKVAEYLDAMNSCNKAKIYTYADEGITETKRFDFSKTQSLNCYNKQTESNFIPPNYTGKNLLRIELQLKSSIPYLPVRELWQPATYEKYINQYCNLFNAMKFKENAQTLKPMAGLTPKEFQDYFTYEGYCSNPDVVNNYPFKSRQSKFDFLQRIETGSGYAIQTDTAISLRSELASLITPEKLLAQIAPSANLKALEADCSTNFSR